MKTIHIKVFPKAKKNKVKESKSGLRVYVTVPAEKGKANVAAISLLSSYLRVKKYHITIISGLHSREKVIGIPQNSQ